MPIFMYFLLHFAIYVVFRLEFFIWNWPSLKVLSSTQILQAFMLGERFDMAALAATFGLFVLLLIWIERYKVLKIFLFLVFWATNIFLILANSGDIELVNFTGRRFSKASFFLLNDGHISNVITPYLGMALMTFALIILYSFASFHFYKKILIDISFAKKLMSTLCVLIVTVLFFRGGLQHKPFSAVESRIFPEAIANQLILNSTFTLVKSLDKSSLERLHFYDEKKMLGLLNQPAKANVKVPDFNNYNIVILILESFSKEYMQLKEPEFTPYLNQLANEGVLFNNSFANARRSIEGLGAILAGIPALMEEPFINSEFSTNEFIGLGHTLATKGYHTSFFHGAKNGSMHFDAFAKSVGLQNYFGANEYPNEKDNDGTWGIYDKPFLKWTCSQLSQFKEPFLSTVFTLSSHQPYKLPDNEFHPEGPLPILKTIHYADSALRQFMACAKEKKWFKNTLFVFTADHTGPSLSPTATFKSKFQIPIIFYSQNAELLKGMEANQPAQQIDILPTLLEALKIEPQKRSFLSKSLWQAGPKIIPLYSDGIYELVGDIFDREEQLKAVRQYFSEGLFDNRLYYPTGSSTK